MKPLGKAMKIAHFNHQNKQKPLNSFLSSYRSIPHPSKGQALEDVFFTDGYRNDFPPHILTETQVKEAKQQDKSLCESQQHILNESTHPKALPFTPGSPVIVFNNHKKKFDPLFGPDLFTVIQPVSNGYFWRGSRMDTSSDSTAMM